MVVWGGVMVMHDRLMGSLHSVGGGISYVYIEAGLMGSLHNLPNDMPIPPHPPITGLMGSLHRYAPGIWDSHRRHMEAWSLCLVSGGVACVHRLYASHLVWSSPCR